MQLFVGCAKLQGKIEQYCRRFELLEVKVTTPNLPKPGRLAAWTQLVPENFHFSVVAPDDLAVANGQAAAIERVKSYLQALEASWLVLPTAPLLGPSQRTRQAFSSLVEQFRTDELRIAWDLRGPWEVEAAQAFADELGITLISDPAREELAEAEIVYSRVRQLGHQSRLGAAAIERLSQRLADSEQAFVIVEGPGAMSVRANLRRSPTLLAEGEAEFADLEGLDADDFIDDEDADEDEDGAG